MAETTYARITRYLQDCAAAESGAVTSFEEFSAAATDVGLREFFERRRAAGQARKERLERVVAARAGEKAVGKKQSFAKGLATLTLRSQVKQGVAEAGVQHLVMARSESAAGMALYEQLAGSAGVVGEPEVQQLAESLRDEHRGELQSSTERLPSAVSTDFAGAQTEAGKPCEAIAAFLEDVIAAEHSFVSQIEGFAKVAEDNEAPCVLFSDHAKQTREDFEQLTRRLESLGHEPSLMKAFRAQWMNFGTSLAQMGDETGERLA